MKHLVRVTLLAFIAASFVSCYDRDIIDFKGLNYSLPKVSNLNYSKQEKVVTLTWEIPTAIAAEFKRPLEVDIQKVENDIYREIIVVAGEETTRDIAIDPAKTYRFVVKLSGYLTDEARIEGRSERYYSEAEVIEIK